jgi:hypothetical protein
MHNVANWQLNCTLVGPWDPLERKTRAVSLKAPNTCILRRKEALVDSSFVGVRYWTHPRNQMQACSRSGALSVWPLNNKMFLEGEVNNASCDAANAPEKNRCPIA